MISYIKQQASDATASCWKCLHWGFIIYNFTFLWDAAQFDFQICMTSNISSLNSDLFGKHFLCGFKHTYISFINSNSNEKYLDVSAGFQRFYNNCVLTEWDKSKTNILAQNLVSQYLLMSLSVFFLLTQLLPTNHTTSDRS